MDTIYYHLNARRVKVSGGADLVTFAPAASTPVVEKRGEILDFDRCRRHLETKAAWETLKQVSLEAEYAATDFSADSTSIAHRDRAINWLEMGASAAVIAVSVAAILAFLRLI